jgi:phosphopantetheine adenylyltransferase
MADVKEKLQEFKKKLRDIKEKYDRSKGARDEKLKTLKEDFGYTDIDEAAKKLVVMKKERKDLIESRDDKISIFEKKYKEVLS